MKPSDLFAIAKYLAPGVLHTVTSETGPISERVAGIEARLLSVRDGAPGRDGRDAPEPDVEAIARRAADLIPVPKDGRDADAPDMELLADLIVKRVPPPKDGIDGADGKDVDPELVLTLTARITELTEQAEALRREMPQLVATEVAKAMASIQIPKDGTSVTVADVAPLIAEEVRSAVAAIPPAKDGEPGASVDPATVEAMVVDHVTQAVSALPAPKDGQSVTVEDVAPLITAEVQRAVAAIPLPKDGPPGPSGSDGADGRDLTVDDVAPLIASEVKKIVVPPHILVPVVTEAVKKAVSELPPPKDGQNGVGVAGAVISKDGRLVLTLSDGSLHELGLVIGRDGEKGEKGDPGLDGANGRDGVLENLKVVRQDERTIVFCFKDGTPLEGGVIKLNHPVFRDKYEEGVHYDKSDLVQRAGSGWIALVENPQLPPGQGAPEVTGWKLFIKQGAVGKTGPPGPKGEKGLDLRNANELRRS